MATSTSQRYVIGRVLSYVALGIAVILVLFPIYWMLATSLKLPRDILRVPSIWPSRSQRRTVCGCTPTSLATSPTV